MRVVLCQTKNGLPSCLGLVHEVAAALDQHLVEGRHVVFRLRRDRRACSARWTCPGTAPADLRRRSSACRPCPSAALGRVVRVGRPGVDQVARADLVAVGRIVREGVPVRIRHRVEVVEVAEELVEAVHRRQELVQVAEVVLAELPGGVALRLQRGGDGDGLGRHADVGAGLADGGHAGADRQLAGDEVGAARGAARLGVVVGEHHALGGQLVEVRRLAGHDAAVVGADVEPADVVAHDDEDVGLLRRPAPTTGVAATRGRRPAAPPDPAMVSDSSRLSDRDRLLVGHVRPLASRARS